MKKITLSVCAVIATLALLASGLASCSQGEDAESLLVYSGAGMRKPMDEVAVAFQEKYSVEVTYNYAGSQALLSQMEITQMGDAYMPGETYYIEVAVEKGYVDADSQEMICYHIPVITVPKGNPGNITCLEDMANEGVKLVWGDPEVAAIGRTGKGILEKAGLYEEVWPNVVATLPTMNEVMIMIAMGQADGTINWWDTVKAVEDIEVIQIPPAQNAIEVVPIGVTTFTEYPETAQKFVDFCASEEGKAIFEKHGFVGYPNSMYES